MEQMYMICLTMNNGNNGAHMIQSLARDLSINLSVVRMWAARRQQRWSPYPASSQPENYRLVSKRLLVFTHRVDISMFNQLIVAAHTTNKEL